ncbi:MAG: ribbon-helix-helix protein, CopG family [Patescibacteria group bacterium]
MHQAIRTQIYLPKDLRAEIDRQRASSGESLAEYLRKAARKRLEEERKEKEELKKLADELGGSIDPKESGWAGVDINKWQREIRRDRKIL